MAQNTIIELQVINHILKTKDLKPFQMDGIRPSSFSNKIYSEIAEFIYDHEDKYAIVPDVETVVAKFGQDFMTLDVTESQAYLLDKMRQHVAFNRFKEEFAEISPIIKDGDLENALPRLKASAESVLQMFNKSGIGTDITQDISRIEEYEQRLSGNGDKTYSLGIKALDDSFGGLLNDDIVLVFARLGHGKSYMMTYLAHALHLQGLSVLFYSGEMSATQVGYRYDSIDSHFSNKALLFGKALGEGKSFVQYQRYLESLRGTKPFKVITPADLGGRVMNMNDIHRFVEEMRPDVIFIDQLSLMEDVRSNKNATLRERYGNIMADFRVLAETKRIPIFVAAQANRQSATKDEEGDYTIPEMHHIAESDAVGHHCTRAIGFCTNKLDDDTKSMMRVAVQKNRHGGHAEFKVEVDFEHGIFEEVKQRPLRSDDVKGTGQF